jgi:hypothetical protein
MKITLAINHVNSEHRLKLNVWQTVSVSETLDFSEMTCLIDQEDPITQSQVS